jgi:hypothetical protein
MQKLFDLDDAALLAWAKDFINTECDTTIAKELTLKEKLGAFPAVSVAKFTDYGFGRFFNDGLGGTEVPKADKVKAGKLKFDQALKGVVGRTRGEGIDPYMVIVLRVVARMVKAKSADNYKRIMAGEYTYKDAHGNVTTAEKPDQAFKIILDRTMANDPAKYQKIMDEATAERQAQERKAAFIAETDLDVDTSDL